MIGGGIPLFGPALLNVIDSRSVSLHGDVYFDVVVRIVMEDEEDDQPGANGEAEGSDDSISPDGEHVQIGEWTLQQPAYQVRLPAELCTQEPKAGDVLEIMFIAQQPSEVHFLT